MESLEGMRKTGGAIVKFSQIEISSDLTDELLKHLASPFFKLLNVAINQSQTTV